MILVTGATGKLGQHVVEQLLAKVPANNIAVAVRDPAKAAAWAARGVSVRRADYNAPDTWGEALRGVDRVLLISGNEVGKRFTQHKVVIEAAKKAHVKLLAYTSILRADVNKMKLAGEHRQTEEAIRASGVPFVFLRNGWYNENYTENMASALEHGALLGAAADGRVAAAERRDYAAAAVAVLTGEGHANKIYELAGDTSFTLNELAAQMAQHSGKPVAYKNMPVAEYEKLLASFGLPKEFAEHLADADAHAGNGALEDKSGALHKLIGGATMPIAKTIQRALQQG